MNKVDILIVSSKKLNYIKNCLESIPSSNNINVFVVVNGFDKEKIVYLEKFKSKNNILSYYVFETKINKSIARNLAISKTSNEIIYFIDDDVILFNNTINILIKKFNTYENIMVIGGPNLTCPQSSFFQKCIDLIYTSPLVVWKMYKRSVINKKEQFCDDKSLILCNLAFRRKILEKENLSFNEKLYYCEENLLLNQIKDKGYKLLYSPELKVYHIRRNNIFDFIKQIFYSAEGRITMLFLFPKSFFIVSFLPLVFTIYFISTFMIKNKYYTIPLIIYLFIYFANSCYISIINKKSISYIFVTFCLTLVSHLTYGTGFLYGIIKNFFKKLKYISYKYILCQQKI